MFSSLDQRYPIYPSNTSYPQYTDSQPQIINSIEFTDLTRPQMEDRRRRKSNTAQDKESVSNMRIVSGYAKSALSPLGLIDTAPASPCTKPSLTACLSRAQREARSTSRTRTGRAREQTPHSKAILYRP